MTTTPPDSPAPASHDAGHEIPEDDSVIGRAFKRSLFVILGVAVLVTGTVFLLKPADTPETVVEAERVEAKTGAAAVQTEPPTVRFTDITQTAGIAFTHVNGATGDRLLPETMGSGVAFLDFDNDGRQDLLFGNSGHWPWTPPEKRTPDYPALYRNLGDGKFADVTAGSGLDTSFYGTGLAVGDYDGDGNVDVFMAAVGANRLFRNLADGKFEEVAEIAGVSGAPDMWSSSAAFFDYDRDGDLDLFVANYVAWSREVDFEVDYRLTGIGRAYGPPTNFGGTDSYLYRNDGDGSFSDVSGLVAVKNEATGAPAGKGLAVTPVDFDGDGWTDLVVANDTVRNFLFRNTAGTGFEETGTEAGLAFDNSGSATGAMGIDTARYNNDEDLAVVIGNFANEMTSFYVARAGLNLFTDEAIVTGIGPDSRQALSFGVFFFDYDLDGRLDLLQTNGHVENEINTVQPSQRYEQPTQLFWNCGPDCPRNFVTVGNETVGDLSRPVVGRGAAYGDLDGDGDPDVVITQTGRPPLVLRNDQTAGNHWIRVTARHRTGGHTVYGTRVVLTVDGETRERRVNPNRSYQSQVELPVTFGLGGRTSVDRLTLHWPDGGVTVLDNPAVDTHHTVVRDPDADPG